MTKLAFDTLAARLILLLLVSLGLFHVGSIYIYQAGLRFAATAAREEQLAERFVSIRKAVAEHPDVQREDAAHALSTAALDIHWSPRSLINDVRYEDAELASFRQKIMIAIPGELNDSDIRLGYADEGNQHAAHDATHLILASIRMPDGSWINFTITSLPVPVSHDHGTYSSLTVMLLGVIMVSFFAVRLFTAPLRRFSAAAERLGQNIHAPALPESGPREVRRAIQAFNQMQGRIQHMVSERTRTLAAISHDLRTPLTRLRLRNEFIADEAIRDKNELDVIEMQALIDSALDYLRGETDASETSDFDVAELAREIVASFAEGGHKVSYLGMSNLSFTGNRLSIRRALSNLVDNAIKYAGSAQVSLSADIHNLRIEVQDNGPGIPETELHKVTEPFYRLDAARTSAGPKGIGLGLAIAQSCAQLHEGALHLANQSTGGLKATIVLPFKSSNQTFST